MKIDISKYKNKIYIRNGKECFLDKTKHVLRIANPEEYVRQGIIDLLCEKMGIPLSAIETEIPLSYFVKGAKGRMDVVVYGIKEDLKYPLMVVECKAPNVLITDDVYEQVDRYANVVDIPFVMVTNGLDAYINIWNYDKAKYEIVDELPSYEMLCEPSDIKKIEIEEYSYKRYGYEDLFDKNNIEKELALGDFFGVNCEFDFAPHVINLAECLLDTSHKITEMKIGEYKFIEDKGVRFTSFGNASGGSYPGLYRYFIVEDKRKDIQIVSVAVCGCMNGRTLLVVAIDDFDRHHNSLQLSLEHFTKLSGNTLTFFHNGTLTVGKFGKAQSKEVIEFVKKHSSLEVNDEKVKLGQIDISNLMYVDSVGVGEFLGNVIEYALVRDEYRREYKNLHINNVE